MSEMNRRQFLRKFLPVVGVAAVAPTILIPERKVRRYWDMGAAYQKHDLNEAKRLVEEAKAVARAEMEFSFNDATGLWTAGWKMKDTIAFVAAQSQDM